MEKKIMVIKELNDSPAALTREQGNIIYQKIIKELEEGNKVRLDFKSVESIITPFLNVSIGKLYETFKSEELMELLVIENIPEGTVVKFQTVIDNAKAYYNNREGVKRAVQEVVEN